MAIESIPLYPKIAGVPIRKDGQKIGEARIEANGEMIISFPDSILRDIVTMIREGFVDGFSLSPNVIPAEPSSVRERPTIPVPPPGAFLGGVTHFSVTEEAVFGDNNTIIMSGAFKDQSDVPVFWGDGGQVIGKAQIKADGTAIFDFSSHPDAEDE
jgi:hypothetical protein